MLRVGLVGLGTIAPFHKEAISLYNDATIGGIFDIDSAQYPLFDPNQTYRIFSTYEDMLTDNELDVIHIMTPHNTHYELAKQALLHGKHVLVEKPFTLSLEHARELIALAKEKQLYLSVCLQHRTDTTTTFLNNLITSETHGPLLGVKGMVQWFRGEAYYKSPWRGQWSTEGGGTLINQAIHTLDLLHYLVGPVTDIKGDVFNLDHPYIEVEDNSYLLLSFERGITGIFTSSNSFALHTGIQLEFHFKDTSFYQLDEVLYQLIDGTLTPVIENKARSGKKSYFGSGHENLIRDFYDAISNNTNNYVKASDTLDVLETLETIYQGRR